MDEPPVKLEIRTGGSPGRYPFRFENEWPLARTQWTKIYLRIDREPTGESRWALEGKLVRDAAPAGRFGDLPGERRHQRRGGLGIVARHDARQHRPHGRVVRDRADDEDTEVTGPLVLNLWVSSTSEDMDIFVTIRNIGPDGKDVCEVGQHGQPVPCVTKGWLRASHRKLDPESRCRTGRTMRMTSGGG